jgi:hypothetical protein
VNQDTVRWLVDVENGGPPRAFECLLPNETGCCGKITRTLSGMKAHQRTVHAFVPQADLFKEESKAEVSA